MHVDAGAANFGSAAIPADDTWATATPRTAVSVPLPNPSSRYARSTNTLSSLLREDEFHNS
jgi:hypothetical protein